MQKIGNPYIDQLGYIYLYLYLYIPGNFQI